MVALVVLVVSITLLLVSPTIQMHNITEENLDETSRIVNGSDSGVKEFRSFVSWSIEGSGSSLHCGGVLLDKWRILTAASCLRDSNGVKIEGDLYVLPYQRRFPIQLDIDERGIKVQKRCESEDHELNLLGSDIAILRLSRPITFDPTGYARLPKRGTKFGQVIWATGFGSTTGPKNDIPNPPQLLRKLAVTRTRCSKEVLDSSIFCFRPVGDVKDQLSTGECCLINRSDIT